MDNYKARGPNSVGQTESHSVTEWFDYSLEKVFITSNFVNRLTRGPESSNGNYTAGKPKEVSEVISTALSLRTFGRNLDSSKRNDLSGINLALPSRSRCTVRIFNFPHAAGLGKPYGHE